MKGACEGGPDAGRVMAQFWIKSLPAIATINDTIELKRRNTDGIHVTEFISDRGEMMFLVQKPFEDN